VTESEIREEIDSWGLAIDEGNLIGGPFISDGKVRIYDPDTSSVKGEGVNIEEAWEDYEFRKRNEEVW
jgi:hypothetical protein